MPVIKTLTPKYKELWKEYQIFLKFNNFEEKDVQQIYFIYSDKLRNKGCSIYYKDLTYDEECMYNYTIDDDCNIILVDNDYGAIYVKLSNNDIYGFRCANYCLKPMTFRYPNIWSKNKISKTHLILLQENKM